MLKMLVCRKIQTQNPLLKLENTLITMLKQTKTHFFFFKLLELDKQM